MHLFLHFPEKNNFNHDFFQHISEKKCTQSFGLKQGGRNFTCFTITEKNIDFYKSLGFYDILIFL